LNDEEPTQRAPDTQKPEPCTDADLRQYVSAIACELDCKHVAILAKHGKHLLGVVYRIVFKDTFCRETPSPYLYACIAVVDTREEGEVSEKVLSLPTDSIIYASRNTNTVVTIFECDADERLNHIVTDTLCKKDTERQTVCIDINIS